MKHSAQQGFVFFCKKRNKKKVKRDANGEKEG